jgi:hypothetical protein
MRKPSGTRRLVYRSVPECSSLICFRTWLSLFLLPACSYHARNSNTKEYFLSLLLFRSRIRTPSLFSCSSLRHGQWTLIPLTIRDLRTSPFQILQGFVFCFHCGSDIHNMKCGFCIQYPVPDSARRLSPAL